MWKFKTKIFKFNEKKRIKNLFIILFLIFLYTNLFLNLFIKLNKNYISSK